MATERIQFVKPVFRGARFESHAVPVDVLPELAVYRDLVVDLARHLFVTHAKRKRVPKGFAESLQLVLSRIDEGSAVPVLERVPAPVLGGRYLFEGPADFFDDARDLVEEVIAAAAKRERLPDRFPLALLSRFNQLGRSLRKDESIEFRHPRRETGARFDPGVRRWLVLQKDASYEDDVDVTGALLGGRWDRQLIFLQLDDGREIEVPCASSTVHELLESSAKRIRVIGLGSFNREERLERLLRVDDVGALDEEEESLFLHSGSERARQDALSRIEDEEEIIHIHLGDDQTPREVPSPLDVQIDDIRALETGWYEPDTPALDPGGLERLRRYLHEVFEGFALPRPYLYPTPEAGVRAEWSFPDWEVSVVFDLGAGTMMLHATHLRIERSEEDERSMASATAAAELREFLTRFAPAGNAP